MMRSVADLRRSPAYSRPEWDELLRLARRVGRGQLGEADLSWAAFRHGITRCTPDRFPLPHASAGLLAHGFVRIASAFALAGLPEDRALIGPILAEVAAGLEELLARQRASEAERGRRVTGERED